ncbi:MAG: phage holin family protein [Chitinophagaceae bacterium]|nr:phage holin family protein [Chitinophagaceae bacterium]
MYSTVDSIEKLVAVAGDLAETKIELLKLKAAGKVSASLSSLVAVIMILVFSGAALTVISFGFAYLIGSKLDNLSYGFFIIGGVYALAGLLIYVNRKKWVQAPLSNMFIDKIVR